MNITCQSPSILLAKPGENVIKELMKIFIIIVTNGKALIHFDLHVIIYIVVRITTLSGVVLYFFSE